VLILYKPFKFSNFEFETSERYIGHYSIGNTIIQVRRIDNSLDLYHCYFYNIALGEEAKRIYAKTPAQIEVFVDTKISELRHANIL